MSYLLSIDTANNHCSAALFYNGKLFSFITSEQKSQQATTIMLLIEQVLNDNNISYDQLGYIATSTGPGSFTGTRIGISVINGIKIARPNINFLGITCLEAIAFGTNHNMPLSVILDASRRQVYIQHFFINNLKSAPEIIDINEIILIDNHLNIGSGIKHLDNFKDDLAYIADAKYVGNAALYMLDNNLIEVNNIKPLYLRNAV
jgi:tRNA threonylcarbamoyladenosine biosynthesis protein TsaB